MILTSHDTLGDTGQKTGFWLEEFASPYYTLADAGAELVLASPKGGEPPLDPKSDVPDFHTAATERFREDPKAQHALATTVPVSSVRHEDFDGLFFPGGHGPLWDLAEDAATIELIEKFHAAGKPVAAVCHGPAVFRHPKDTEGKPLVNGKKVTGFSNSEEAAVQLTDVVPFLVEEMLKENGGTYQSGDDWQSFVVEDGGIITGQNPASSEACAKVLLNQLN